MEIIGLQLPIWAVFLIGIIAVVIAWKIIKFAIKVLIAVLIIFFVIMGLDYLGFLSMISSFLSGF